jgi:hypothetical protein
MTHDELLDKIYWHWKNADDSAFHGLSGYRKALRAVVELHKPIEGNEHLCSACWFGDGLMSYPCPTIQAIEKEMQ